VADEKTIHDRARSRAARMKMPGCMVYCSCQPPIRKLAANGRDVIVDTEATTTLYEGKDCTCGE
jgi:hypothetical protein